MTDTQPRLRRVLTFWPLLFYGLGVIVGAGIYVAIGKTRSDCTARQTIFGIGDGQPSLSSSTRTNI